MKYTKDSQRKLLHRERKRSKNFSRTAHHDFVFSVGMNIIVYYEGTRYEGEVITTRDDSIMIETDDIIVNLPFRDYFLWKKPEVT